MPTTRHLCNNAQSKCEPVYPACWSQDDNKGKFWQRVREWWHNGGTYEANLRDKKTFQEIMTPQKIKTNMIIFKANKLMNQNPEYVALNEYQKSVGNTAEEKFSKNILKEISGGFAGNFIEFMKEKLIDCDIQISNPINIKEVNERIEKIRIICINQAEKWYQNASKQEKEKEVNELQFMVHVIKEEQNFKQKNKEKSMGSYKNLKKETAKPAVTKKSTNKPTYAICCGLSFDVKIVEQFGPKKCNSLSRVYASELPKSLEYLIFDTRETRLMKQKNLISVKKDEILMGDQNYIEFQEEKKRVRSTPESEFVIKFSREIGFIDRKSELGILLTDFLHRRKMKKTKKEFKVKANNQAISWCNSTICHPGGRSDPFGGISEKNSFYLAAVARGITDDRNKKNIIISKFNGSQEEYRKPCWLLYPTRAILANSIIDYIIRLPLSITGGKPGKILGHGVTYLKKKGVEMIDDMLDEIKQHNLKVDKSRAEAAMMLVSRYQKAVDAEVREVMAKFTAALEKSSGTPDSNRVEERPPFYQWCLEIPDLVE